MLSAILAVLSGATSYRKVHRFVEAHLERLNGAFGFGWKTAPAYSAIRTILHGLDPGDVERVFRAHAAELSGTGTGERAQALAVVAMDGKTLRHSFDAFRRPARRRMS